MGQNAEHEFWTSGHEYEDLAKTFEQNIEVTHPQSVTSKGMCVCLDYCSWCGWAGTKVDYPEYRGPDVKNI